MKITVLLSMIFMFVSIESLALDKKALLKECKEGFSDSCIELGNFYKKKKKNSNALKLYKRSCKFKNDNGCYYYAKLLAEQGEKQKALKVYKYLCKNGIKEGCLAMPSLVSSIEKGGDKPKKKQRKLMSRAAESLYKKSCKKGNAKSCYKIAKYLAGAGEEKESQEYYKLGCKKGDVKSCSAIKNNTSAKKGK